jgi:HSP20 family molecular chaperone IbpA
MDSTNILRLTDETEDPIAALLNLLRSVVPTARRALAHAIITSALSRVTKPRVRVMDTEDAFLVKIDVPGVPRARIHVTLDPNGLLRIAHPEPRRGRKRPHGLEKQPGPRPALPERVRIVTLGPAIIRERAAAVVESGVLNIFVPKKKAELEASNVRAA